MPLALCAQPGEIVSKLFRGGAAFIKLKVCEVKEKGGAKYVIRIPANASQ